MNMSKVFFVLLYCCISAPLFSFSDIKEDYLNEKSEKITIEYKKFNGVAYSKFFSGVMLAADLEELLFSGEASYDQGVLTSISGRLKEKKAKVFGQSLEKVTISFVNADDFFVIAGHGSWLGLAYKVEYRISLSNKANHRIVYELKDDFGDSGWQPVGLKKYLASWSFSDTPKKPIRIEHLALIPFYRLPDLKDTAKIKPFLSSLDGDSDKIAEIISGDILVDSSSSFNLAVVGEADIFGGLMRVAVLSSDGDSNNLVLLAEAKEDWSLEKGFPYAFGLKDSDKGVMHLVRSSIAQFVWKDASIILSSYSNKDFGVVKGLMVEGIGSFAPTLYLDPVLQKLAPDKHALPIYLKQDGDKNIAARYSFVLDPAKFKDAELRMALESGDVGLFFRFMNSNEMGIKNFVADIVFKPFALEAVARCGFSYAGYKNPMKASVEIHADEKQIGTVVSGSGDEDFTKTLEALVGPDIVTLLGQKIILRDIAFECNESWASLLAALPTAGLSLYALSSVGLSGGIEVGPKDNPLQALFKIRGGLDLDSWLFELFYDSKSSWLPLVFFLADVFLHAVTFGQKDHLTGGMLDMARFQSSFEHLMPAVLDGFYFRVFPRDTRMGELKIKYGLGGNIRSRVFGQELGVDLLIDHSGVRAVGFMEPFDWGVVSLFPSQKTGPVVSFFTSEYNSLNDSGFKLSNWGKNTEEKLPLELLADEKGFHIGTNVGVRVGKSFVGELAGVVGAEKFLLQGGLALQLPGLAERLGLASDGMVVKVMGHPQELGTPLDVFKSSSDFSKILLEVEFSQDFTKSLQKIVSTAFDSSISFIQKAVQKVVDEVFVQSGEEALANLRQEKERLCSGSFGLLSKDPVNCALLTARLALLEGKNFALDSIDQLTGISDSVRGALQLLSNIGLKVLDGGKVLFDRVSMLATIERVYWRGTLEDFTRGLLTDVVIEAKVLGIPVVAQTTFDLLAPVKSFVAVTNSVLGLVRNNLSVLIPGLEDSEFKEKLDELEKEAEEEAVKRLQEELNQEEARSSQKTIEQESKGQVALIDGWDDLVGLAN